MPAESIVGRVTVRHRIGLLAAALLLGFGIVPARSDGGDKMPGSPKDLFARKCSVCHREGGMGTIMLSRRMSPALSMLERRTDLAAEFVEQAARQGIGNMPPIQRGDVSDTELHRIALYLTRAAR